MFSIFKNSNIPNVLTLARIFSIPAFVFFFYLPFGWGKILTIVIFLFAAITDWIDGYLARSLKQTTKFGAFLDPVADKLMVAVTLILIVGETGTIFLTLPAAVIVGREIVISALREWMAEIGKRTSVAVGRVAKIKTFLQMLALFLMLIYRPSGQLFWQNAGLFLLYIAAILTLWSMVMYLKASWPNLTLAKEQE
jgi:CDP-diacylglycerol---glycerol-3-phosphate 3-phosphatidyltransferase